MAKTNDREAIEAVKYNQTAVNVGAVTASDQKPLFATPSVYPPGVTGIEIDDIVLVGDTAITASDTNYWTIQATDKTASADLLATALTTKATGGTGFSADTAWRLTPDQNNTSLAPGTVVELDFTKTASATSFGELTAYVLWHWEV